MLIIYSSQIKYLPILLNLSNNDCFSCDKCLSSHPLLSTSHSRIFSSFLKVFGKKSRGIPKRSLRTANPRRPTHQAPSQNGSPGFRDDSVANKKKVLCKLQVVFRSSFLHKQVSVSLIFLYFFGDTCSIFVSNHLSHTSCNRKGKPW